MNERNLVKIKVPNTKFWILGEKQTDNMWNVYLIEPQTNYKEFMRKSSTKAFVIFSNVILKTPFPHEEE